MANLTFADIKQDIKNKTGNQQAKNDQLGRSANRGYQRLITKIVNLPAAKYYLTKTTITITAGDPFVDLPQNFLKVAHIYDASGNEVHEGEFESDEFRINENAPGVAGAPMTYILAGYNTTTKLQRAYISPQPGATETWTLWYHFMPAKLDADGDQPLIPEIFDEVIMLFGTADMYENQQNRAMASYYLNRGTGQTNELINDLRQRTGSNPKITRTSNPSIQRR